VSKSLAHAADYLAALFYGEGFPQYGDTLWISGHSADPGRDGSQSKNELDYPAYRRVGLRRGKVDWSIEGLSASNAAHVVFARRDGGTATKLTHVGIGTDERGAGLLLHVLKLENAEDLSVGRAPLFPAGALTVTEV
jgi:hypothetical protein